MRRALLLELVAALSGALILVNTVGYVRGTLKMSEPDYGWVMTAFGVGATLAALAVGIFDSKRSVRRLLLVGASLTSLAVVPAGHSGFVLLLVLWLLAGAGQNWVNLGAQTVIANETEKTHHGRVYGAHFAWSHLWWAFAYPIAGLLGERAGRNSFLIGGGVSIAILLLVMALLQWQGQETQGDDLQPAQLTES